MYEELGRKLQECTVTATTLSSLSATHVGAGPLNSHTTDDPLMTVSTARTAAPPESCESHTTPHSGEIGLPERSCLSPVEGVQVAWGPNR